MARAIASTPLPTPATVTAQAGQWSALAISAPSAPATTALTAAMKNGVLPRTWVGPRRTIMP